MQQRYELGAGDRLIRAEQPAAELVAFAGIEREQAVAVQVSDGLGRFAAGVNIRIAQRIRLAFVCGRQEPESQLRGLRARQGGLAERFQFLCGR